MDQQKETILKILVEQLDLPDSAYEKAKNRYDDLGDWFNREDSILTKNNVHIYPQGSFLLGTAIRPVHKDDEYDLDLACKLREGVSRNSHTQKNIKDLVGKELERYRNARGIKEKLETKHRCWRLEYHDKISFHLDIVPAIPADEMKKSMLFESMNNFGVGNDIAKNASETAISITDDRDPQFNQISDDWNLSNPEGYGVWFKEQMKTEEYRALLEKAKVDEVPIYKRKTPLQRCVQLLKRHRDIMFANNEDSKPISIIITTLAARAYNGEKEIFSALNNILENMNKMINHSSPRVPNPVNPEEDFADRWSMSAYSELKLEENFMVWMEQARIDFGRLTGINDPGILNESFNKKFAVNMNQEDLNKKFDPYTRSSKKTNLKPKEHHISEPAKPWKQ